MPDLFPEVILQTINLRREYRVGREPIVALGGVDISIRKGEFVAIMGASGSGKSTLLNLLGGLDQPTAGKVILDGHDLSEYSEEQLAAIRREKMGFIFQRHDLFPVLTVHENVEFPMLLDDIPVEKRLPAASNCSIWRSWQKKPIVCPKNFRAGSSSGSALPARSPMKRQFYV